jgi:hypothetical protein
MKQFLKSIMSDERGRQSSKRLLAIIGTLFLCGTMIINACRVEGIELSSELISAIEMIVITCVGSTTIDKFSHKVSATDLDKNKNASGKSTDI